MGSIRCDVCHRWLHLACCGIHKEDVNQKPYCCLSCTCNHTRSMASLPKTKCVMVVVPDPILNQWSHEVNKHFSSSALKVQVYHGCNPENLRKISVPLKDLYPATLAGQDVLLVSLRTIQAEFHLANIFPGSEARKRQFPFAEAW